MSKCLSWLCLFRGGSRRENDMLFFLCNVDVIIRWLCMWEFCWWTFADGGTKYFAGAVIWVIWPSTASDLTVLFWVLRKFFYYIFFKKLFLDPLDPWIPYLEIPRRYGIVRIPVDSSDLGSMDLQQLMIVARSLGTLMIMSCIQVYSVASIQVDVHYHSLSMKYSSAVM